MKKRKKKEYTCSVGHLDSISGSERCPGEGNCLLSWEIPWTQAVVHSVARVRQLNHHHQ